MPTKSSISHLPSPIHPAAPQPILHVDMTPGHDLPLRVLRAYRANCDVEISGQSLQQRFRADYFDAAIATLERADKFRRAARKSGKPLGRPAPMARLLPRLAKLYRDGMTGPEIHAALGRFKPSPSLSWVFLQITKLKNKKS